VTVILRGIQAGGYTGGSTMLRLYVQPKRALRPGRATGRFETEPGKQLQSDWGEIVVPIVGSPTWCHKHEVAVSFTSCLFFHRAHSMLCAARPKEVPPEKLPARTIML
jgi:hypothetical protein